eukprot:CAMPEP_0176061266 /NCGR_PEP_ID=MMETSP0120_2-20121206/30545_1 /TAXON_ID=160619 /ORGANISM="Kryptoperidinium foliaceum, Strain CCMP 1326" /LENGTH=467 /DNA_ID=CAMNT_0017394823 /DNA_START=83 /DNA_END=1486 /DNA_ORIENTATION=-
MPLLKRPAASMASKGSSKATARASASAKAAKAKADAVEKAAQASRKKPRVVDPLDQKCASVMAGLRHAALPMDTAEMLTVMLESAMRTTREERHSIEASVLDMADETLSGVEAQIMEKVATTTAAIEELQAAKASKHADAEEAERTAVAALEVAQNKKRALAEVALSFQARRKGAQEAHRAAAARARAVEEAAEKRSRLQVAQASWLRSLIEGDQDEAKMRELVEALATVIRDFQIDSSIQAALPNAGCKPPSQRGPFDTMVLVQLEAELAKRVEAVEAEIRDGRAAAAADAEAEGAAEAALQEAQVLQLASAKEFQAAAADRDAAKAAHDAAIAERIAVEPRILRREKELAAAERRVAALREGPKAALAELRDRSAPAVATAPEPAAALQSAVAPEPVEEAAPESAEEAEDLRREAEELKEAKGKLAEQAVNSSESVEEVAMPVPEKVMGAEGEAGVEASAATAGA